MATINGTNRDDTLNGTVGNDTIYGLDGNDIIDGLAGNDTIDGGTGNDSLNGNEGIDTFRFAAGGGQDWVMDLVAGETVQISGYTSAQSITQDGTNVVVVLSDTDRITFQNTDVATVEAALQFESTSPTEGDDVLTGTSGDDVIDGLGGNDVIQGLGGNDMLTGGAGIDTASYALAAAGVTVSLAVAGAQNTGGAGTDTLTGFESLTGSAFNDVLTGNDGANVLTGLAGDDFLRGGSGADTMVGGTGDDKYHVNDADDVIVEAEGEGSDRVLADVTYVLAAGVAVERLGFRNEKKTDPLNLTGNEFGQLLHGNAGNNVLDGRGGNDSFYGGDGTDTFVGGTGNDIFNVNDMSDVIVEYAGEGDDIINAWSSYTLAEGVAVETMKTRNASKTTAIDLTGNSFDNLIVGNAGVNVLSGGGGNDRLRGDAGNDTLIGGAGWDQLTGGSGNDRFVFTAASDSAAGTPDEILDFASGDIIDLGGIDANAGLGGDQAFAFIGTGSFTNTAGQLRYEIVDGNTYLSGDVNGDGTADFTILVTGSHALTEADLIL